MPGTKTTNGTTTATTTKTRPGTATTTGKMKKRHGKKCSMRKR